MNIKMFFQLIRWKNLLLGVSTLTLIKFILFPKFIENSSFSNLEFYLFALSILSISAGGYIFNDSIDIDSDLINKPNKSIIGTNISKTAATKLYIGFSIVGLILGIYISISINQWILGLYFLFLTLALYCYSKQLKSVALIGNFTVALLISSSILILPFFEKLNLNSFLFKIILAYVFFAFLVNFIREIVKDIEDVNGDFASGYKTLPIVIGRKRANSMALILSVLLSVLLVVILTFNRILSTHLFLYGIVCILIPILYFIFKLNKAKSKREYQHLSLVLKCIMLLGILSIFTL